MQQFTLLHQCMYCRDIKNTHKQEQKGTFPQRPPGKLAHLHHLCGSEMLRHAFATPAPVSPPKLTARLRHISPGRAGIAPRSPPRGSHGVATIAARAAARCGADAAIVARCLSRRGRNAPHRHWLMGAASTSDSRAELGRKKTSLFR